MSDWNRVFVLRRLRGPAMILLTGVIALLDQFGILTWSHAWPLYLILLGVIALAERAALAAMPPDPYGVGYPSGYPPAGQPAGQTTANPPASGSPAWTRNAAEPEQAGLVPVSPFTSLAASPAEPRYDHNPEPNDDEKESHR